MGPLLGSKWVVTQKVCKIRLSLLRKNLKYKGCPTKREKIKKMFLTPLIDLETFSKTFLCCKFYHPLFLRYCHRGQDQEGGLTNWTKRHLDGVLTTTPCLDKSQNSGFLRKSIFFIFGGPKKLLWPQKPYLVLGESYF